MPARPPEPSVASLRDAPGEDEALAHYWTFYWAVAAAQLARWLPRRPARILDLAGGPGRSGVQAAAAGHRVIQVLDPHLGRRSSGPLASALGVNGSSRADGAAGAADRRPERADPAPADPGSAGSRPADRGRADPAPAGYGPPLPRAGDPVHPFGGENGHSRNGANGRGPHSTAPPQRLIGDSGALGFLTDGCVDAVIAENRVLSRHLVTEAAVAEIARVLRPGGRVLLSVDSLTLGMALLAEQNCWAHLSDVPSAEVLLVPWPDGTITRCFWAEQLRELLADAGLEVEWIRPRTVLSPSTVEHVLSGSPRALPRLVRTELNAPLNDDSLGVHLLASARRPG
ncbi:methyltransferase [Actinomadura vinacea]|uniref:methyltransferase n=1 Tax=Actinomadura vinacea TaxID=115336 RepID=UPI0031DCB289